MKLIIDKAHEIDNRRQRIPNILGIVPSGTKHLRSHTSYTPSSALAKNVN